MRNIIRTEDEFTFKFTEYYFAQLQLGRLPTIPGFCAYVGMSRQSYNNYRRDPAYSLSFEKIDCMLEDAAINSKMPQAALYLKSHFNYNEVDIEMEGADAKVTLEELIKSNGEPSL